VELRVDPSGEGIRLDKYLSKNIPDISRTRLKDLIKEGFVLLDGTVCTLPKHKVKAGQLLSLTLPKPTPLELIPQRMDIETIFEDEHIVVVNKPPNLVVHPGAGNTERTLVHGLLHQCTNLSGIGGKIRPGIVHRLDKDTSGVMVVAKSDEAHSSLTKLFKARAVKKVYLALVHGQFSDKQGLVDLPIGRHPVKRTKMAVDQDKGRNALTHFKVKKDLQGAQLLEIRLFTGRTHQIRVHMAYMKHPILGDKTYGGPSYFLLESGEKLIFPRQMLHAWRLEMFHPVLKDRKLSFEAPVPPDMVHVIKRLQ